MDEPRFATERQLEDAIASAIHVIFSRMARNAVILRGFGLDLAVFGDGFASPRLLEVKNFASHHGRCGFGNQKGEGNQIRLLFDSAHDRPRTSDQLAQFDKSIRWILGDSSRPMGTPRYALFTCLQASEAAMGGVHPGKQNNFRLPAFHDLWATWPNFLVAIEEFLKPKF